MSDTGTTYIDNSTLSAVSQCSTQALLRYGLDYTTIDESALLLSGQAGHEAVAVHLKGGTKDEALAVLEELYAAWAEANLPPDDRLAFDNFSMIVATWIDRHPLDRFPFIIDPAMVEVGFAYPLTPDGKFVLTGRADWLARDRDTRALYVIDNKFTSRVDRYWAKQFKLSSQMIGYAWGVGQTLGEDVAGCYINAIETSKLPSDPVRKCKDHATPYSECGHLHARSELIGPIPITAEHTASWLLTAKHNAKRFADLKRRYGSLEYLDFVPQEGFFNRACKDCGFMDFCTSGRRLDLVSSMLTKSHWEPFDVTGLAKGDAA